MSLLLFLDGGGPATTGGFATPLPLGMFARFGGGEAAANSAGLLAMEEGMISLRDIKKGATDQSVLIRIVDSATFLPETGVTSATGGLDLKYRREGATVASLTESDLAAVDSAHSDGGMIHVGAGYYRIDLPDAACATGANGVAVFGTVTDMVVIGCYVHLVDYDPQDTVRLGLTALPNAAAEASGGLYTRGTGAGQINQPANGLIDVNVENWNTTAVPAEHTAGYPIVTVKDGTGTGEINTTSGRVDADVTHIATAAVSTSTAQLGVNVVNFGGSAGTFSSGRPEVNASHWAGAATATNDVALVAAPSNFASLAITAAGGVTLGDGVAHGGTGGSSTATLALDNVHISSTSTIGLQVVSTAADAARFRSTGGNGDGLEITGNGSGNGIRAVGGSTGHGAAFVGGGTSGSGVSASATTDGDGIILAGASNGHGMRSTGAGSGTGIFAAMTGNITGTITTATNVTTVNGLAAGVITATSIATGAIDADAIAADAVTEIQSGLSTLTQAQVQTECEEALQTYHLDHLIASADPGGVVANSSFWAKLHSKSATPAFSSYDNTTDSLEALRDNVGTAGAGLTAADDAVITAIAALNNLSAAQVNAEVLDVLTVDTLIDGKTFVQATQYVSAITAGRVSGAGTGTEVFKGLDESTTRVTVTVDGSGNRTDITYG